MPNRYALVRMNRALALELLHTLWDTGGVGEWANLTDLDPAGFPRQTAFGRELDALLALPETEPSPPRVTSVAAVLRVEGGKVQVRLKTDERSAPLLVLALASMPELRGIIGRCKRCGRYYLASGAFGRNRFCSSACRSAARPRKQTAEYMRRWRATRKLLGKRA